MEIGTKKPEILAPVGDRAALYAAIYSGADAVYLGVNNFNARAKCENFTTENVGEAINKAHLFGVKTYITLNTLIKDCEIDDFLKTFDILYNAKADAFIVQDIGMAALIKKLYPSAVLHASTQMGIHNLSGAEYLEKCGYKRVILSRETKLSDIALIKKHTDLEIEYFVQGALCVAFSGNCYLSSVKDGNSGNRGKCHQLCRLNYSCESKSGYLLSPNDLCLADNIPALCGAGVTSFKIEGRMKRPAYVAAAVRCYRAAVDGQDKETVDKLVCDLKKTFSRGEFNKTAYLYDNDDIIDVEHNNNTGEEIGFVSSVRPFKDLCRITVESNEKINVGDGLTFEGKNRTTIGVGSVEKTKKSAYMLVTARKGISVGDRVYRTLDVEHEKNVLPGKKLLPVDCTLYAVSGNPAVLTLSHGETSVSVTDKAFEKARTNPLDKDLLSSQIKFGDAPFALKDLTLVTDGVFAPKSVLNAMRRTAVEKLTAEIIKKNSPNVPERHPSAEEIKAAVGAFTSLADGFDMSEEYALITDLKELYKAGKRSVIYSPSDYNLSENMPKIDLSAGFYLSTPIIATQKDVEVIDRALKILDLSLGKKTGVVANNYYALKYLGFRPVIVGTGLNVYNKVSGGYYLKQGAIDVISSGELSGLSNFLSFDGNLTLMTLTHCPYKVSISSSCSACKGSLPLKYVDERGNEYIITRYKAFYCYFELKLKDENEYRKLVPKTAKRKVVTP